MTAAFRSALPLALYLKPYPFERPAHYVMRLRKHHIPYGHQIYPRHLENLDYNEYAEELSGLPAGYFAANARHYPDTYTGSRMGCVRCSRGSYNIQSNHSGPFVCYKHRRFIAPNVQSVRQSPVGYSIIKADKALQKILHQHKRTAYLLFLEVLHIYNHARTHTWSDPITVDHFRNAVIVTRALLSEHLQAQLCTAPTWARAYKQLNQHLASAHVEPTTHLLTGLWLLLRPAFQRRAEQLRNQRPGPSGLICFDHLELGSPKAPRTVPLMSDYLSVLRPEHIQGTNPADIFLISGQRDRIRTDTATDRSVHTSTSYAPTTTDGSFPSQPSLTPSKTPPQRALPAGDNSQRCSAIRLRPPTPTLRPSSTRNKTHLSPLKTFTPTTTSTPFGGSAKTIIPSISHRSSASKTHTAHNA